jgi:hypothetical protein
MMVRLVACSNQCARLALTCRQQCEEAVRAADASETDQHGHLFNAAFGGVHARVVVDGKDPASFASAVKTVQARVLDAYSACSLLRHRAKSVAGACCSR